MINEFIQLSDRCKVLHDADANYMFQLNHTFTVESYIFSMTTEFNTDGTIMSTKLYFTKLNNFYQELDPNDECAKQLKLHNFYRELDPNDECAKQLLECVANQFGDEMVSECKYGLENDEMFRNNYAKFIDEYVVLTKPAL